VIGAVQEETTTRFHKSADQSVGRLGESVSLLQMKRWECVCLCSLMVR
jgi:hypothetical protein